jgi:hypothetical protein
MTPLALLSHFQGCVLNGPTITALAARLDEMLEAACSRSRIAGLEEAAKIADAMPVHAGITTLSGGNGYVVAEVNIAAAIRKAKEEKS